MRTSSFDIPWRSTQACVDLTRNLVAIDCCEYWCHLYATVLYLARLTSGRDAGPYAKKRRIGLLRRMPVRVRAQRAGPLKDAPTLYDLTLDDPTASARCAPLYFKATVYGDSVGAPQSKSSMARRAEFQQIAAKKFDAALNERELHVFMASLKHVIRARVGFTATARKTGLNRTALYKTLSSRGNPKLSTLVFLLSLVDCND